MTRTEALLSLAQRQRRFEWQLARDEQTRAASAVVAGKTHDLLNLVQIVNLVSFELERRSDPSAREFLDDLQRAADDAKVSLRALMETARPVPVIVHAPIGPAIEAARHALDELATMELRMLTAPATVTRCTEEELEHLVLGLALDAIDHPFELEIRERMIDGKRHVELLRCSRVSSEGERFELRAVESIAQRAGGELAVSERRGGGVEVVVALPVD
ncbi:MAG: hypothetical protein WKG01_20785 [Kofleriaceae bacterium]